LLSEAWSIKGDKMAIERIAELARTTRETDIRLRLVLDGSGSWQVATGVPFLDHMLSHVAVHGLFDLEVTCRGDTIIDDHHSVEDIGIVLGQAFRQALGDKLGIVRYGSQLMPMDEALVLVALDFSGRALLVYDVPVPAQQLGAFDTELVVEFLRALAHNAGLTLHVKLLHGSNAHHIIEAIFKGLGRALGQAVARDPRRAAIPSTKGVL
jgi:imidazoleglycerol-phosphate dehydratase